MENKVHCPKRIYKKIFTSVRPTKKTTEIPRVDQQQEPNNLTTEAEESRKKTLAAIWMR